MSYEELAGRALLTGARLFESRINRIAFLIENDCDAPWTVYLETFFPAAGQALLVLFTPSPGEVLENYLEPKPGRKGSRRGNRNDPRRRRSRNGGLRRRFRNPIPDVDSLIAGTIFGRSFFEGRRAGPLEGLLWQGINIADRLAWWWLIIDVTDDFIMNWSSAIMESKFCQEVFNVVAVGRANGPVMDNATDILDLLNTEELKERNCNLDNSGNITDSAAGLFSGTYLGTVNGTAETRDNPDERSNFFLRLTYRNPDVGFTTVEGVKTLFAPGQTAGVTIKAEVENADFVTCELRRERVTGRIDSLLDVSSSLDFLGKLSE